MSFTCFGTRQNLPVPHQHDSVLESKRCNGLVPLPISYTAVIASAVTITRRQLDYIRDLGGDVTYAAKLTREEASSYIDSLKTNRGHAPAIPTSTTAEVPRMAVKKPVDPRLAMIQGLLGAVPEGRFAVRTHEGGHITFIRISRPKNGKFKGTLKVQTQHAESYQLAAVQWPSGTWSNYTTTIVDDLLLLCSDHHSAARLYSKEMDRCARCGIQLTDGRSRHYNIGPECEKHWPWMIEEVDADHDFKPFERLGIAR